MGTARKDPLAGKSQALKAALARGRYEGSSQDRADGFIHFSAAAQVVTSGRG